MWETICDAQPRFWLNSKFLSKFSRKPLSGISDQKAPPPHFRKVQIWDDQSLLWNTPPPFGKLQIWDDQSLLRNTPPIRKTADLRWPKFTLEYPPPHFRKLQIWDDQSLLWNQGSHFFYPIKFPDFSLTFPWFPKSFPWFFLSFHQDILVKKKHIYSF